MTFKSLISGVAMAATMMAAVPALAKGKEALAISVYNPGEEGIFAVSSEIVSGPHEVMLVDAQFSTADARALVAQIKATGKTLRTVYISHSDPDYYFGLETIRAAFPDARIVATPQTVAAIQASKDGKLAFWGPILKENAPKTVIVPEVLEGDTLTVDGRALKIVGLDGPTPDRTFLWVPSNKAVIGGIPVVANEHVWIADTQTPQSRTDWKKTLDGIAALKPAMVVPGHYALNRDGTRPFTLASVKFTRAYLDAFEAEAAKAADSTALIAAMKRRYPGFAGEDSLTTSAKVIKGEMKWPAEAPAAPYPAAGKKVEVNFGGSIFELTFTDDRHMSFVGTTGQFKGATDSVEYVAKEIRPNLFMVYWHEPKTGDNVVHVQDFEKGVVHTNIASPDGKFLHLDGTIRILGSR